jgi:hypothetical protein
METDNKELLESTLSETPVVETTPPDVTFEADYEADINSTTLPPSPGFGGTPSKASVGGASLHHSNHHSTTPASKFRLLMGLGLGLIVLVCISALTAAVYLLPFSDKFVRSVTSVVPYPVAVVNMQPISFGDFYQEYDALQSYYTSNSTPAEERLSEAETSDNILGTIIDRRIIDQLAKQYQVSVDDAKVNETLQAAYAQGGTEEEFTAEIKRVFGWDKETFLNHVIKPMVLASQVEEVIQSDATLQVEPKTKIDGALASLKNGELFATVAVANSEDTSATNGGDLGYLTADQMPPEWLAFFASSELNIPSEVIDLGSVYSVVEATDKVEGEEGTKYTVKAIIVYKKGLDSVIESFKTSSKIWKFLKTS